MVVKVCKQCGEPVDLPYGPFHWMHAEPKYCVGVNHKFDSRGCDDLKCLKN